MSRFICGHVSDREPTIEPIRSGKTKLYNCKCEFCVRQEAINLTGAIQAQNTAAKEKLGNIIKNNMYLRDETNLAANPAMEQVLQELHEAVNGKEAIEKGEHEQIKAAYAKHRELYQWWLHDQKKDVQKKDDQKDDQKKDDQKKDDQKKDNRMRV